ncbi:DAD1 [Auxenochlorella protothecoides x Auxenochlorella symbiontica]
MATLHTAKQVLDAFSGLAIATALLQFVYAVLIGSFPFNAFLAGFFCCIGAFVLSVCLRMQVDPEDMSGKTERAFTEYALAMCVLFLAALNYVG